MVISPIMHKNMIEPHYKNTTQPNTIPVFSISTEHQILIMILEELKEIKELLKKRV
jgi:hypothetical protein